jgi:hypothetical protein
MSALRQGERFEGFNYQADGRPTVYRVTLPASENVRGWTFVWDESMSDTEAAAIVAEGGAESGVDPRARLFPCSFDYHVRVLPDLEPVVVAA